MKNNMNLYEKSLTSFFSQSPSNSTFSGPSSTPTAVSQPLRRSSLASARCCGFGECGFGEVLWLRRVRGQWLASDADSETSSEYVVRFSSNDDILSPRWHSWRMWEADGRVGQFETTVL